MFLSRTVSTVTELFRSILIPRRRSLMIGMAPMLIFSFMVCAGVLAGRSMRDGNSHIQPTRQIVPPANHSHVVRPAGLVPLFDVSATPVTTVPSASFEGVPVAPDSIVTAFGSELASDTVIAPAVGALPTELGGTTVEVNGRRVGLFFVSPGQINYLMPADTALNSPASVVVKNGTKISSGTVMMAQVAPAIFTANATGRGVPAANILRVFANGQQRFEELKQFVPPNPPLIPNGRWAPKPIDLGPVGEQVFLVLYLSGIRQAADDNQDGNSNESIRVLIGGNEISPPQLTYAGKAPGFVGLDQINVLIPRDPNLLGRTVNVSVTGLGYNTSNLVDIEIAGPAGVPSLTVNAVGPALAGSPLIINGSGFSAIIEENEVTIGSSPAEVMEASATQLKVMVPFGVETGTVLVKALGREGRSTTELPVRTSVSGVVETTDRQPLEGVTIRLLRGELPPITYTTGGDGTFVLADVETGRQIIEVDGGSVQTIPPYPQIFIKPTVYGSRDNQYTPNIALQQQTGNSALVGGGSFSGDAATSHSGSQNGSLDGFSQQSKEQSVRIQTGDFQLQFPANVKITTPDRQNSATLVLTPLENARTPVALPFGYYNSSIVQITPFDVKIEPGAKLTFPNTDGYPAGTQLRLFRYDQDAGKFVEERSTVAVSADGKRIETGDNDIKVTSYYFASIFRNTTTIVGRVLESDRKTPVQRALVRYRGQESYTDGNGSYVLRYVTVDEKEPISVEVSTLRASTRVDRVTSTAMAAAIGSITKMPDVILPDVKENRPPTIVANLKLEVNEGREFNLPFPVTDPDGDAIRSVTVSGASFAKIIPPSQTGFSRAYTLQLNPGFSDARTDPYRITITATDARNATNELIISVFVRDTNRPPTAISQSVTLDEDTTTTINLAGNDEDNDRLTFKIVSGPSQGQLDGTASTLTYKPNLNVNGTDRFTFVVNDGKVDSAPATVTITIRPINDPPFLTVPGAQTISEGQPLSFAVSAFDPDTGQNLTFTAANLPTGATFTQPSPSATSAQFLWTPSFTQAGAYTVNFTVADNGSPQLRQTKEVRITVSDVSMLVVPGSQTVNEGQNLSFDVSALPGLSSAAIITLSGKPDGAEFPDAASNTAKFRWTPGIIQAGSYDLTFKATINSPVPVSEMKVVQITVNDVVRDLGKETTSYSIFGASGPLPLSLGDDGDGLGASLATGDLNGDGVADLAAGAPAANGAGLNNGKVYIFFGQANLAGSIDLGRDKADVEILGEAAEDRFGSSLAIGDLNGDGKNDLAIGAPLANAGGNLNAGKVYVIFSGLTAGASDSITKLAGATVLGGQRSERIGTSLAIGAIAPKTTQASDLLVGAPGFDSSSGANALIDAGAVHIFFGGASLARTIDLLNTSASYTVTGTLPGGQIGATLAVGNFNGDTLADFAIGGPLASANGAKGSGVVYLALGAEELTGARNTSQASSLILSGGAEDAGLGTSLAMGDLNGDGRADLILSAISVAGPGSGRSKAGAVYIVYGREDLQNRPADLTIYGAGPNNDEFPDALGKSLAVGDFNGDGIADLAIGAPGADNADSKRDPIGAVYVIFGARTGLTGNHDLATKTADWTVLGADPGDNLGGAAIAIANLNASEPADVILGIPKARSVNNARTDAGEVRAIYGIKR